MVTKNYFGTLFKNSGITNTFGVIFPNYSDFYTAYKASPIPQVLDDPTISIVYYLLYGKYKNSHIKGDDQDQFKLRLFTYIFQFGPKFSKQNEIRNKIQALDLSNDDWRMGAIQVYNTAEHSNTSPGTLSIEGLDHLDSQSATLNKRGVLDSYATLYQLASIDVVAEFINAFQDLFNDVVTTSTILLYEVPDDD